MQRELKQNIKEVDLSQVFSPWEFSFDKKDGCIWKWILIKDIQILFRCNAVFVQFAIVALLTF